MYKGKILKSILLITLITIPLVIINIYKRNSEVKGISFETQPTINIVPELNISRFGPYQITAENVLGSPESVFLEIWGENGNGGTCWDYYADGTCNSSNVIKNMTYADGTWTSDNIYPDSIYPEIYFAESSITWGNVPLSTNIRRNEYHLVHYNNPFTIVDDMYFYIEVNAFPTSLVNSADLEVYLVQKGSDINRFNSDWRNSSDVELVGTFSKVSQYHHSHSSNSTHKLIPLATNSDGTVGAKHIDINEDFWVIFYSNSPNNARGWTLQYQPSTLCDQENRWFTGDFLGWTTTSQSGCPDTHIHIARRNLSYMDGIEMTLTANYPTETAVSDPVSFYFGELPNLPPISTSFTSPSIGGTYSGSIDITWDPSSDPNNDPIEYNIYLLQNDSVVNTLASSTSQTSLSFDTTTLADGNYSLLGEVCDSVNPCIEYSLNGDFTISNTLPIQTISSITLSTTNSNPNYAKAGDNITLEFNTTGTILNPVVEIYSAGNEITEVITETNIENNWQYAFTVSDLDTNGLITFTIISDTLDKEYLHTTDSSSIYIDTTPPSNPEASPIEGTYPSTSTLEVILSSTNYDKIFYSLDSSSPNCNTSSEYLTPIFVLEDLTIRAVACDLAGNISGISTSEYLIKETLLNSNLSSNNPNTQLAKVGDKIILTFTSSGTISSPIINLYIDDQPVIGEVELEEDNANIWRYSYTLLPGEESGIVTFNIQSQDLYTIFNTTTDDSSVTVDTVKPTSPNGSLPSGLYSTNKLLELTSTGATLIKYTLDNTIPTCNTGNLYLTPIPITHSVVVKAIGCDNAGNVSTLSTFTYLFENNYVQPEEEDENDEDNESNNIIDKEPENIDTQEKGEDSKDNDELEQSPDVEVIYQGDYQPTILRRGTDIYISEIRVKIVDQENQPVKGLTVFLYSQPKEAITDLEGIAVFRDVLIGNHEIVVEYENRRYTEDLVIERPLLEQEVVDMNIVVIKVDENSGILLTKYIVCILIPILLGIMVSFIYKKRVLEK